MEQKNMDVYFLTCCPQLMREIFTLLTRTKGNNFDSKRTLDEHLLALRLALGIVSDVR